MHVNDPMRRYYWFFFICEGIVFGMILLQAIVSTLAGRPNYFFYGEAIFFLLLLTFAFFSFKRRHQRTEVRRQHALLGDPAFRVELTSERGVARWFQLGPRRTFLTWFTMLKPDLSLDEYHEKMTRLQQVIVARTGKPLYDLRDEKIVWW